MSGVNYDHANPKFPEGLRVLVVDDNMICLKLLSVMLTKCNYKVTATTKATEALDMLRTNKDSYDIVITDVVMLDMDGFQLLEKIGLEMDIPVILVSANDDTELVMRGIKHGARDYLLKPVQLKELKHIWQHVVRKKLLDPIKPGSIKVQTDQSPMPPKEKSKEREDETHSIQSEEEESPARKKQRLVWSKELHEKFVDAVTQLGVDKAVPKKILKIMNEPKLSRENIASHLQKHRKSLNMGIGKDNANWDVENNIHSNKTPETAAISPNHQCFSAANHQNSSVEKGIGDARINSIRSRLQRYGASLVNKRLVFYNSQEMLPRQNLPAPPVAYQMRPTMPLSMLGSGSPTPICIRDPFPQPELSGMTSESFQLRTNMDDNYLDELSQIPGLNVCQPTRPSSIPIDLVPYSLAGASNPVDGSFQMLGDASTQFTPLPPPDSPANLVPSSSHGQHVEGINLANNFNGRGETTRFSFDGQGQIMNDLIPVDQLMNVQYFFDNVERESTVQSDIRSTLDDDELSAIVKQFCSNSGPGL